MIDKAWRNQTGLSHLSHGSGTHAHHRHADSRLSDWSDSQHASVEGELEAVLTLETRITAASKPVVLPTITLKRFGLLKAFERFLNASGLAYATTPMDKDCSAKSTPPSWDVQRLGQHPQPYVAVEDADLVVDFGGLVLEDLNTGSGVDHSIPRQSFPCMPTGSKPAIRCSQASASVMCWQGSPSDW